MKQKEVCTAIINKHLKVLAGMALISKPLSTHIARQTFARMAVDKINNPMVTMKIIIVISLTLCSLVTFAQKQDTVVFKKAEKLILKTDSPSAANFLSAGKSLIENNFLIANKDEQFGQLTSEPIKLTWGQQVIFIVVKDDEIVITSKYKSDSKIQIISWEKSEAAYKPVTYNKQNDTNIKCFNNMLKVAKSIGSGKIIYSE